MARPRASDPLRYTWEPEVRRGLRLRAPRTYEQPVPSRLVPRCGGRAACLIQAKRGTTDLKRKALIAGRAGGAGARRL
jgi:hypothetical protein